VTFRLDTTELGRHIRDYAPGREQGAGIAVAQTENFPTNTRDLISLHAGFGEFSHSLAGG
jgi:hypothetical protein